jgi:transaldolase
VQYGKGHGKDIESQVDATLDNLLVQFGKEILQIIPGKVSTEVDARFSFSTEESVNKALHIIDVRRIPPPYIHCLPFFCDEEMY